VDTPSRQSQVIFRLSSDEVKGEISLKPDAWHVLTQANGARTIGEIARNLGLDEATTFKIADSLFQSHLLEVAPGSVPVPSATVGDVFFKEISYELTFAMGPLASMVIEDEIAALGEKRESFPRERLADLVEHISASIKDEQRRLEFQRVMLEAMRKL
jgi:hypothetical protein